MPKAVPKITKSQILELIPLNLKKTEMAKRLGVSVKYLYNLRKKYKINKFYYAKRGNDILNKKFGKLLVIKRVGSDKYKNAIWLCLCECGNQDIAVARFLINGEKKSCGCWRKSEAEKKKYYDISHEYWNHIYQGAKKRGYELTITKEQIWDLYIKQNRKCFLTGVDIKFERSAEKFIKNRQTASIDRVNSYGGYHIDNIQLLHKAVNLLKLHYNQEDLIVLCNLIANQHPRTNKYCVQQLQDSPGLAYPSRSKKGGMNHSRQSK